jgi:hypothetical protein
LYERGFSKPVVIGLFRFLDRLLWLPEDPEKEFDDKMSAYELERKRERTAPARVWGFNSIAQVEG